jgi:hypothetical protein
VPSIAAPDTLTKLLGQYRDSAKVQLRSISVLQYDGRPLGADFNEAERTAIFRFGQHLAVSGLSDRRFIGGYRNDYTAAGHYQVVIQGFTEPFSGSVSLSHRRKDGQSNVLMGQSDVHFVRPAHLVSQGEPNLNLRLLTALQAVQTLPKSTHEHVDASVTQYLLANTDSPDVPLDAESIATYAALERVSNSDQTLKDIQRKLPAILELVDGSPWTEALCRELGLSPDNGRLVLHSWLAHFYRLRGNVAHGKPAHWQPNGWTQQEHLVAGAFAYPLVLKCLLAQHELYALNEADVAWVLGMEGLLADKPFYEVPPTAESSCQREDDEDAPPSPRRTDLVRWQLQFGRINDALLSLSLRRTMGDVLDRLGNSQADEPPSTPT